jgi:hypothetical protein
MEWITQDELAAHITEYGEHSYEAIVVEVLADQSGSGYIDIMSSHKHVNHEIGRVCIVQAPPSEDLPFETEIRIETS